jgi:hypothetical protein
MNFVDAGPVANTDREGKTTAARVIARAGGLILPILWFAIIATGLTAPLWDAPHTLIGDAVGDNASFLWNFWWAKVALSDPAASLFSTDRLCAPIGTNLVLHTGTPFLATLTSIIWPRLDAVAAYNLWIWAGFFLNGLCTYYAAFQFTQRRDAALLAGTIFATAPCLVVRANGHLNVLNAWGLPLVACFADKLSRRPRISYAVITGGLLGVIALTDYYYVIFASLLASLLWISARWHVYIAVTPLTLTRRRMVYAALALIAIAVVMAVVIAISGGTMVTIGSRRISVENTFNLRVAIGFLSALAAIAWLGPRVRIDSTKREREEKRVTPYVVLAFGVALLIMLPLAIEAVGILMSGDYVEPGRRWRSSAPGLDAASLVLGNPLGLLFGDLSRAAYDRFHINRMESIGWLGIVPTALFLLGLVRFRGHAAFRQWLIPIGVFGVWSLGPYLMLLGTNTAIMLPQMALRIVPLVNNARMPSRAYIVVVLGVSLIAALVVASSKGVLGRRWWPALALIALTLVDFWPRPFHTTPLDHPVVYDTLASAPKGIVLELPLGLRDGFADRGRLDHLSLYYQTLHGQPIVGGFVARLSSRIIDQYTRDPVFSRLLVLSGGRASRAPLTPPASTLACAVRYVMIPAGTSDETRAFVRSVFELESMAEEPSRSLYRVSGFHSPYCTASTKKIAAGVAD